MLAKFSSPLRKQAWAPRQARGRRFPCGAPTLAGVMPAAGSQFSISNQFLACCGLGPSLSIIQEWESVCCLMQDLLLFNRTKPR